MVFTVALYVIGEHWHDRQCPCVEKWLNAIRNICTMEDYVVMKNLIILGSGQQTVAHSLLFCVAHKLGMVF